MSKHDAVNRPDHYNQGGVECIDAIAAATSGLEGIEAHCTGNGIKYLWRWKLKNGAEDLKKAKWYIDRLLSEIELPPAPIAESEESIGVGATLDQSFRWPMGMGVTAGYVHHCKCTENTGRMFSDPREFATCPSCGKATQGKWNG